MQKRKTALFELNAHLWWNIEVIHTQVGNDVPIIIIQRAPNNCSPIGVGSDSNAQATWLNPNTTASVFDLVQSSVPLFEQDGSHWLSGSMGRRNGQQ